MKIDREKMKEYAALPDDKLWTMIRRVASEHGYELSLDTPQHDKMEKIREVLRGDVEISMGAALRLLKSYKSKK